MSFELKECPVCLGGQHREILLAKDRHYGIPGVYRVVRCVACSLVFLNPMYSEEELSKLYPQDYYAYGDHFHSNSPKKDLIKRLLGYRLTTNDPRFSVPGRVLDLGCGAGWFLHGMRKAGWETHGVEINRAAAELGQRSAGLNIFPGTLKQANFPPEWFDYVRSNHSFEHISTPDETLNEIHRVLKPQGKVMIGVPNVKSLNAWIFGQYWWYLGAPVHTFTYSDKTLSALLSKHGFAVEKITYNSNFAGILGSFQIWLNRRSGRKSTEGILINNLILRLVSQWVARFVDLWKLGDAIEITAVKRRMEPSRNF